MPTSKELENRAKASRSRKSPKLSVCGSVCVRDNGNLRVRECRDGIGSVYV
jgi:hypothetical protein